MKLCLTIDESCQALGIGRTKLYQLINSGALPARKVGKRTFILAQDIHDFVYRTDSYPIAVVAATDDR